MIGRVRDRATFDRLARAPRLGAGGISARYVPDGSRPPRVAFAIGRRVGGAVTRNRLRRRILGQLRGPDAVVLAPGAYLFGADRSMCGADVATVRARLETIADSAAERASEAAS